MIDFREELRTVHKPLTLLPEALPGEVLLPGRVRIGGGRGNEILEKAAEDLEGAGATTDHRTKGTASGKDDEHVASASPELPLADGLAACAKAAS